MNFAGLSLRYPIVIVSSGINIDPGVVQRLSDGPVGALVLPAIKPAAPYASLNDGEYAASNRDEAADRDTDRILQNLDADAYLDALASVSAAASIPVFGAICTTRRRSAIALAEMMINAGAAGVELQPFDSDLTRSARADQIEKQVLRLAAGVVDALDTSVSVRLPVGGYGIAAFLDALAACGVAGVSLSAFDDLGSINTDGVKLEQQRTDAEVAVTALQSVLAVARRLYRRVSTQLSVPIPANRPKGMIEAILSGATTVELHISLDDQQKAISTATAHIRSLQGWMGSRRFDSLFDMRGLLCQSRLSSSLENK